MLQGLPVALLDYHNCPHYVPAAWTIAAREHIERVILEMIDPPKPKLHYQQIVFQDALECHSPATPRFVDLIKNMHYIAEQCIGSA
jgi:hypothetical protein